MSLQFVQPTTRPGPNIAVSEFNASFRRRTKLARESAGYTMESMAVALVIPRATYAKYENRSPMPHHLVVRFSIITDVDIDWLYTGARKPSQLRRRPEITVT